VVPVANTKTLGVVTFVVWADVTTIAMHCKLFNSGNAEVTYVVVVRAERPDESTVVVHQFTVLFESSNGVERVIVGHILSDAFVVLASDIGIVDEHGG